MQPIYQKLKVLDVVPFGQTGKEHAFFALRLANPGWKEWQPGQFVMLRPDNFALEQIWGRPFSICHLTAANLVCFIKIQGKGTKKIAALQKGADIAVWGPLGNYFAVDVEKPTLILAGGIGMAPFVGYVNQHPAPWLLSMFFGHREALSCYPLDNINRHIPVDTLAENTPADLEDIIYIIHEKMADCASQGGLVLACGPTPFLRTVRKFALETGVRCQLSLENRMACGVGACLGCVAHSTDKWPLAARRNWPVQVCSQGPVFWADQIQL